MILDYKGYDIVVAPQPNTGDNKKVFFRVTKNGETEFTHWQIVTGTSSRGSNNLTNIYNKLINDGIKQIHSNIDNGKYVKGGESNSFSI